MAVVLTWNVAGRVRGQEAQLSVLAEAPFDVLCLQEVTPTTRARWEASLGELGLHVAVSEWSAAPRGSRRFAVLVAAREPLSACPPLDLPWPERHLAVRVGGLEVHTLHAPLSSKEGQVKVRTLEVVFAALTDAAADGVPRVLTGDLNTPRYESREGEIFTFARTAGGRLRADYGERHDRAELLLIDDLVRRGWRDAFRSLHGYGRRDRSWFREGWGPGWRLDHIIASPELEPVACDYLHEWREAGLSDHSAMWARLRLRERTGRRAGPARRGR